MFILLEPKISHKSIYLMDCLAYRIFGGPCYRSANSLLESHCVLVHEYLIISEPKLGVASTSCFEIGSSSKKGAHGDLNADIMIINSSSLD